MILFTELGPLVRFAKLRSLRGTYDGRVDARNQALMRFCSHLYAITPEVSARMIYTRDVGHHTSGWWKNPEYEQCLHLSISFCANPTDAPLPFERCEAEKIARAFFQDDASKCWVEPPYSPEGKRADVHHYRLFCDAGWQPILPRGEVYSRELTGAGWKSFSEIHGYSPTQDDAPFLKGSIRMTDLVVTCPKGFWWEWIREGDPAGAPYSGEEWGWYMRGRRPPIEVGDRLYVVAHDRLRGYAPVTAVRWNDEHGHGHIARCGDAVAVTIDQPVPGFQSWRYVWWRREDERPFPDWQNAGVPLRRAA